MFHSIQAPSLWLCVWLLVVWLLLIRTLLVLLARFFLVLSGLLLTSVLLLLLRHDDSLNRVRDKVLLSLAGAPLESVFCLCIALMDSVRRRPLPRRRRCRRLHPDLYSLSLRQLYRGPRSSAIRDKKARARSMPNGRDSAVHHPVHVISGQRLWLIAADNSAHTKRYGWCPNCCPYRLRSRWENAYRHCAPCSFHACIAGMVLGIALVLRDIDAHHATGKLVAAGLVTLACATPMVGFCLGLRRCRSAAGQDNPTHQ